MSKKLIHTKTEVDGAGNVKTFSSHVDIKKQYESNFCLLLTDYMFLLKDVRSALDLKVFIFMATLSEYNAGYVKLTSYDRKALLDSLGTNRTNFGNALTRLKRVKLISGSRDRFYINPLVFWKGGVQERDKMLKSEGKKILSSFGYSLEELKEINKRFGFLKSSDFIEGLKEEFQNSIKVEEPKIEYKEVDYLTDEFEVFGK